MGFTELEIKDLYITDSDNIPEEFYGIVLPQTIMYKRAAGFFSSSALATIGRGLKQFYNNDGNMRLLVSPQFSIEDYEAIELGYKAQEDIVAQRIVEMFDIDDIGEDEGTNILSWLIYENRLEIRVVVKKKRDRKSIFHDKFSVLIDECDNRITFRGSMNESETAMKDNYESIEVDCSWEPSGYRRSFQREKQFDEIWDGNSANWSTIGIPQAVKESLIKIRRPIKEESPEEGIKSDFWESNPIQNVNPIIPHWLELRPYQKKAIAAWVKNGNKGIFEMATGTGKTKTCLAAITKVLNAYYLSDMKCGLIIVVPYIVLLEQWIEDLHDFSINPIACFDSRKTWEKRVHDSIELFNKDARKQLFIITTMKTFSSEVFQQYINNIQGDYVFCADEMHHLISDNVRNKLPQNALYRLGLSATLQTKYDYQKMSELKKYFGDVVYEYTMQQAIQNDFLTKYYYYPIYVTLTDDEKYDYYEITKKISKIVATMDKEVDEDDVNLKGLLNQRSRVLASASNKLTKLKELIPQFSNDSNLIVYCGDKIEADVKFIDKVHTILKYDCGIIASKFTADETKAQRKNILDLFKKRLIQALVAIRCLDEGVDIPQLEKAIILSSGTNPKEFIQRRGRILRKSPGKEYAYIYDFIVIPTLSVNEVQQLSLEDRKMELKIISREFERVKEFVSLSENGFEITGEFLEKWKLYTGGIKDA